MRFAHQIIRFFRGRKDICPPVFTFALVKVGTGGGIFQREAVGMQNEEEKEKPFFFRKRF